MFQMIKSWWRSLRNDDKDMIASGAALLGAFVLLMCGGAW